MSWREVPEPTRIARLPHDQRRGFPIPYIVPTKAELGATMIRRCGTRDDGALEGLWLASPAGWERGAIPGPESRVFTTLDYERTRECMVAPACMICALPLAPPWVHIDDISAVGDGRVLCTRPPLCRECARYSLQVCPALGRAQAGTDNYPFRHGPPMVFVVHRRLLVVEAVRLVNAPFRPGLVEIELARADPTLTVGSVFVIALEWSGLTAEQFLRESDQAG